MAVSTRHLHHQHLRDDIAGKKRHFYHHQPPAALGRSTAALDALSEGNSDLARFLFVEQGHGTVSEGSGGGGCLGKCRDNRRRNDEEDMPRMNALATAVYSLALEPMGVRSEKITMAAEALTIFGALFLGGTFILFEWGSPKGYGGDEHCVLLILCEKSTVL